MYYVFSQKEEGDGPQQRIFQFDKVHDSSTGNEEVHRVLSLPAVELSMEGFNVSIFCYGQTGAGKTHTMIGVDNGMQMTGQAQELRRGRMKAPSLPNSTNLDIPGGNTKESGSPLGFGS